MDKSQTIYQSAFTTAIAVLITAPVFLQSLGGCLFSGLGSKVQCSFSAESRLVFLCSSLLGQLGYTMFSALKGGILIYPIFEFCKSSSQIHAACIASDPNGFINTLVCLIAATLLGAALAFALSALRLGKYIHTIPFPIIICIVLKSSIDLVMLGCYFFFTDSIIRSTVLISISIVITIGLMATFQMKKNPLYAIAYMLFVIAVMNLLRGLLTDSFIYQNNLFIEGQPSPLSFEQFFSKISTHAFDARMLFSNWLSILTLAVFPLVPHSINLPIYANSTMNELCPDSELRALGFSNLFSAIGCFPTYFNCTASIMLCRCGATARAYGFIAVPVLAALYFIFHHIVVRIPIFIFSVLPLFIGLSLLSSYLPLVFNATFFDILLVLALLLINHLLGDAILMLATGILLNALCTLIFTGRPWPNAHGIKIDEKDNQIIIKAGDQLDFYSILSVSKYIEMATKNVVVDMSECRYIDMSANIRLKASLDSHLCNGYYYKLVGHPKNLYKHLYNAESFIEQKINQTNQ